MITAISFKNFKSFKNEVKFEIKPITLIYGLNGSGKSSILQILQLLKQSLENSNEGILLPKVNSDDSIDLGSYEEFIYQHKRTNDLEVKFHGNITETYTTPSIRSKIAAINRENIDFNSKQLKIRKIIQDDQVLERSNYSIKIIFNLDENSNIHQRKVIIYLEDKLLLEVEREGNNKNGVLKTNKYLINEKDVDLLFEHLKTKTNNEINKMVCSYNNKKIILSSIEAITLKWFYVHCKINNRKKWKFLESTEIWKKISKLLNLEGIDFETLIKSINRKFKEHPSIRKEFKFIKLIYDKKNIEKNILFWDIDFNNIELNFFLDPENNNVTYKDILIADFELAIDSYKNKKQYNMENVYRPIDPSHPLASSFNQGILNNENNVDSILKFVSDIKNKKLTKKLLKKSIENNFSCKFWREEGFLIRKDSRTGGFGVSGQFRSFLGTDFEGVMGSYFMDKIKLHAGNYKRMDLRKTSGPDNIFKNISLINDDIRDFLRNIFHLAPQAIKVPRINTFKGTTPNNVGQSGTNMPDLLFKSQILMKKCNETLKELKIPFEISVERLSRKNQEETGLYELRVFDKITKTNVQVSDTGYGISQLITFMVHLINSQRNQITMKEELEAHLHPSWQIKLPDLIHLSILDSSIQNKMILSNSNRGQKWILETHSEHLILKIKKMIKEKNLNHNNVSIYYAYKDKKTSSSKLDKIELDEDGKFIGKWRDGFFQERMDLI